MWWSINRRSRSRRRPRGAVGAFGSVEVVASHLLRILTRPYRPAKDPLVRRDPIPPPRPVPQGPDPYLAVHSICVLTYISLSFYDAEVHAFDILGDPVRRRILELLASGS